MGKGTNGIDVGRRRSRRGHGRRDCALDASSMEPLESRLLLTGGLDPSLTAWFDADAIAAAPGAAMATWTDSSGMGFNASQANPSQRPTYETGAINGHAAVHFNAAAGTQLAFARPVSGDFTIVIVFRASQGLAHDLAWFDGAGLVDGEVSGVTNDFGVSLNAFGQVLGGTGNPDTFDPSGLGFNDNKPHVATFTRTAATGTLSMYVDGRLFKTVTGAGTQALTAAPRMTIGSLQTNLNYFTGDIAEIQIYGAALSDSVRTADESQLEATYNIAPSAANWFTNPVINMNFPDPGAVEAGGTYYAFATNGNGRNVQAAESTDLVHWTQLPDALPMLPPWAAAGKTWAPDAALMNDGVHYAMYFTAASIASGRQAIGVATATNPAGPYTTTAAAPLISQSSQGGSIDPSVFTAADGTHYLLWKNDGNAISQDTFLYIQRLSADGLSLAGSPVALIREDQTWEGRLVEAPVLWQHKSKYFLFYSANSYAGSAYATGYAVASSPFGPYTKPAQPLLKTENGVVGPGGPEIVVGPDGNTWMLYHSWENQLSYRSMSIDELTWNGDVPVLRGPSRSPQPVPVHPTVRGRFTFYSGSALDGGNPAGDDAAIASDKQALRPGSTAAGVNVTGYVHGITGIMVDVSNLPLEASVGAGDFSFRAGSTPDIAGWSAAPTPTSVTVRRGAGAAGSDRISITWANDAIVNEWLGVTLNADGNTALAAADTFCFGNLAGDTGNDAGAAGAAIVSAMDVAATRTAAGQPVSVTTAADFNKDGIVDAADGAIARANLTHSLVYVTLGAAAAPATVAAPVVSESAMPPSPPPTPPAPTADSDAARRRAGRVAFSRVFIRPDGLAAWGDPEGKRRVGLFD